MSVCQHPEKIPYASERAATAAMRSILKRKRDGGEFLHVYRCGGHFHVGHGHKARHRKPGRKFR